MKGLIAAIASILLVGYILNAVRIDKQYESNIGSYWTLSERASTLPMKSAYMDKFVAAVDSAHLSRYNAIIFKTPQQSVEQNVATLRSLQLRLHEIQTMDVTSFAYQQAISQITAQEQGEAEGMLTVIAGAWCLEHYPFFWGWISAIIVLSLVATVVGVGFVTILSLN